MPRRHSAKHSADPNGDNFPNPVDEHIGKRLRERRMLKGMSQGELAHRLGITFQQIQKYERAANRVAASRLHDIAAILGVAYDWFLEGAPRPESHRMGFGEKKQASLEGMPSSMADTNIMQRRETLELTRAYYSITDVKQRRKLLALIKSWRPQ